MSTSMEQWNAASGRRQSFSSVASTRDTPMNWVPCEKTGDPACPINGYRYYGGVGSAEYGPPDATPELATFNRDILARIIVLDLSPEAMPDSWVVAATGQPVGWINGSVVLPGQTPPPVPAPPATNQPIPGGGDGFLGIHADPSKAVGPTGGSTSAPAAPDPRIAEILARVQWLTPQFKP